MHKHIKIKFIINAFFASLSWLAPTFVAKTSANLYALQIEFELASSALLNWKMQRFQLKCNPIVFLHLNYFIWFSSFSSAHLSWIINSPGFPIYAGVWEKEMDKKKAEKPADHNCSHGSNKYTNGSHGYPSKFVCVCFISRWNVTHLKKLLEKLDALLTSAQVIKVGLNLQSKLLSSTNISLTSSAFMVLLSLKLKT